MTGDDLKCQLMDMSDKELERVVVLKDSKGSWCNIDFIQLPPGSATIEIFGSDNPRPN